AAIAYPLAALAGLAAVLLFQLAIDAPRHGRRGALLGASTAAFVLALLSHPVALAFTPAFVLLAPGPRADPRRWARMALAVPPLAAAAGFALLTARLESPNAFGHVAPDAAEAVRGALELVGSTVALSPAPPDASGALGILGLLTI